MSIILLNNKHFRYTDFNVYYGEFEIRDSSISFPVKTFNFI